MMAVYHICWLKREYSNRRYPACLENQPAVLTFPINWLLHHIQKRFFGRSLKDHLAYRELNLPQLVWGTGAWIAMTGVVFARLVARWPARRAAVLSTVGFGAVLLLYVAFRVVGPAAGAGKFL